MARFPVEPTPGSAADLQAEADPEQVARTVLLRRLTAAPRTRHDLRTDLLRRNIPEDVADRVLDRFAEVGLIDDASFAQAWVESRQRSRGTARSVLRQELRAKGVADDDAQEALASIDPEAERERAAQLVRAKLASTARLDSTARARRLTGMLQRRGYPASVAYGVVREVLAEGAVVDATDDPSVGLPGDLPDDLPDETA
jgi:regulatory protein